MGNASTMEDDRLRNNAALRQGMSFPVQYEVGVYAVRFAGVRITFTPVRKWKGAANEPVYRQVVPV